MFDIKIIELLSFLKMIRFDTILIQLLLSQICFKVLTDLKKKTTYKRSLKHSKFQLSSSVFGYLKE